jgi:polyisoprenoid-binding protein YceI
MKTLLVIAAICLASINTARAQTYLTKNGKITFFSRTSMENIDAVNNQVVSVLDSKTGGLQFSVQVSGFLFKKALMQEHFNGDYMESAKYPKATFKGKITDMTKVDFSKDGSYAVNVAGDLSMHGVTNTITVPATIIIAGGKLSAASTFNVGVADYKIDIPKVVQGNISKSIEIKVDCNYQLKQ